jgi:predicted flap endonuclease-1-like 5' DNA nuclease
MAAYFRLVLGSVCRSNHHRLAILALEHLRDDAAGLWRDLFLHNHVAYLEGAKAPDEQFKDFKNHVLHVREGDWGGAPAAAREWYRRTVRALQARDWRHAAYCAGVMSHYVVDPVQPFHTGQTETEGVIHRAVEWSFSKAFPELHLILEQDVGYPDIDVPGGDDWLEQMVRAGAAESNPHYETVIDHYDFEVGRKKPEAGLDQELKDVVAGLLGYAAVLLARILDRAFAEAQVAPPKVNLVLDTVFVAMKAPINAVLKSIDNAADRALVAAQYEEFRKTGKVRETLSDDDRVVRALHADEVLKMRLASLDCLWPKETGLANGQGAPARVTRKARPETRRKPADAAPSGASVAAPVIIAPPARASASVEQSAPPAHPAEKTRPRIRLAREAAVVDAPSIGPKTASRLNIIGVKTVADLLALSPDDAAGRIKASHINARVIRDWQAQALLACSVPEITGTTAQMLVGAGVDTPAALASADIDTLLEAVAAYAASSDGERLLRGAAAPDRTRVEGWIASARARDASEAA